VDFRRVEFESYGQSMIAEVIKFQRKLEILRKLNERFFNPLGPSPDR
jgi:hypothetical protein